MRDNAHIVDVCDRKADGHRAYARVVTKGTYPAYRSPYYDSNDAQAGLQQPATSASQVVSISVCVQTKGCSAFKSTGVAPPDNTTPRPTPTPYPAAHADPAPPPPPPPPSSNGVALGVGLDCAPRGKRMPVSINVHKRKGKAKPRVKRVVFYYRKNGGVVARSDRNEALQAHAADPPRPRPAPRLRAGLLHAEGQLEAAQGDREAPVHRLRVAFRG